MRAEFSQEAPFAAALGACMLTSLLEASIRNGDIHGLQLFSEAAKHFKPISWKKDVYWDDDYHEEEVYEVMNYLSFDVLFKERWKSRAELRSGKQEERDEVRRWDVPTSRDQEHIHSDRDDDERRAEK